MITHGPSNVTTQQLHQTVSLRLRANDFNGALALIDQCDNFNNIDFNWTAIEGPDKGLTLLHLLISCLTQHCLPNTVASVLSKLNKPLDFNKPAENQRDKGITPLWMACLAAVNGRPETLTAILALPSEQRGTLDFNKAAEDKQDKGITPLWLVCASAANGYTETLNAILTLPSEQRGTLDFNKAADNEHYKGKTALWLACATTVNGYSADLNAILALPLEQRGTLDFNKAAEDEQDKGITSLWLACSAAANGYKEPLNAILALPSVQRGTLDFNKAAESEGDNGKTPLWLACQAAISHNNKAIQDIIEAIPYASLDFVDLLLNLNNTVETGFFLLKVRELSKAEDQLRNGNLVECLEIFEKLSQTQAQGKPHLQWIVEKASIEIAFALLNRDISKTGHNLDTSMNMFHTLRIQAVEHALKHACALSDESLKIHCVKKLLNLSPATFDKQHDFSWVTMYKDAHSIIEGTRMYKAQQVESQLEIKEQEMLKMQAKLTKLTTACKNLTQHFIQSEPLQPQDTPLASKETFMTAFNQAHTASNSLKRCNTSMLDPDTNHALEPKKKKAKK